MGDIIINNMGLRQIHAIMDRRCKYRVHKNKNNNIIIVVNMEFIKIRIIIYIIIVVSTYQLVKSKKK
jgi:hypothetical protein